MSAFTALLIAGIVAPQGQAIVSAFDRACVVPTTHANVEAAVLAEGWQAFTPEPKSMLADLLVKSREMMREINSDAPFKSFWRQIEGRRVHLVVHGLAVPSAGMRVMVGCNLYDFDATKAPADEALTSLGHGVAPKRREQGPFKMLTWEGTRGPHSTMRAAYIPAIPEARAQLGFTGTALSTSFFENAE